MSQKRWVVGVDVGGTFTDLFVLDEQTGTARIVKVPSTRGEEARLRPVPRDGHDPPGIQPGPLPAGSARAAAGDRG